MNPVSTCPKCGAPIYMPTGGNGTQLPMAQHTCLCRLQTTPQAKPLNECPHGVDDGACKECYQEQINAEPVAMRYEFDGYGYQYIDSGSGSDWQTRIKDAEPLYTTPQTELKPTLVKVDGKLVAVTMTDEEHRIHEVLWEAPQIKPLSDEEIRQLDWNTTDMIAFARAIEERILGK